jgi:RimJ/RimL family protein N-acetyltransferase
MQMPRIYGERIMLREYQKEDLESIRQWVNEPEVVDNLSDIFLYPHTLNQTENFLNSKLNDSNTTGFVIADSKTGEYIGQIDLIEIDWKNRCAILGVVIGDAAKRGKGYGTEAILLLEDFAFNRLNLNKLELNVHDYNTRAYRCYLKCGFKEEGRFREKFFIGGQYTDMIAMGILKREYEVLKGKL